MFYEKYIHTFIDFVRDAFEQSFFCNWPKTFQILGRSPSALRVNQKELVVVPVDQINVVSML